MAGEPRVHVDESLDAIARRAKDAVRRYEAGEDVRESHLSFESWEGMVKTLSGKRLALLRHLHRHPAASVSDLARALGRDERQVRHDVEVLTQAGLIDQGPDGLRAEYDEIRASFAL